MKPYVGLSDVLFYVRDEAYQTCQPCEPLQLRGKRPFRRCDEPAYVVRGSTPPAIIDPSYEPEEGNGIDDADGYRLCEYELQRLQTFPCYFTFEGDTKRSLRQQIGNAVPPRLAEAIAHAL